MSTTHLDDANDAARLLSFACQPRIRPLADNVYHALLERYRSSSEFRDLVDSVADGIGLEPVAAHPEEGLVVHPQPDHLFSFRLVDYQKGLKSQDRMMLGLIHVAIAARAYPTQADLEDDSVKRVSVTEIDEFIRGLIEEAKRATKDDIGLTPASAELDTAWRAYEKMPAHHKTRSGQLAQSCTHYWITSVLEWLLAQGHAQRATEFGTGHYRLLHRFRLQISETAANEALLRIGELSRQAESRGDDATQGSVDEDGD